MEVKIYCSVGILAGSLLLGALALAQESTTDTGQNDQPGWTGGISVSRIGVDAAPEEGLGDYAVGLDIFGTYHFSNQLIANVGVGYLRFDDKAEFQQQVTVTDLFGSDVETADSTASAIPVFAEINYQSSQVGDGVRFRVGAGYSHIAAAEREIPKCTDCREEDLSVDGGAFVSASVRFDASARNAYVLSARQYLSGDLTNSVSIWFEYFR